MAARWRWHNWHVAQETSSRCVAGQITTARPLGVTVFLVVVDGTTTTTGPHSVSAKVSASFRSVADKLTVNPQALACLIHARLALSRWCE
jgi:hypothetical protein